MGKIETMDRREIIAAIETTTKEKKFFVQAVTEKNMQYIILF